MNFVLDFLVFLLAFASVIAVIAAGALTVVFGSKAINHAGKKRGYWED